MHLSLAGIPDNHTTSGFCHHLLNLMTSADVGFGDSNEIGMRRSHEHRSTPLLLSGLLIVDVPETCPNLELTISSSGTKIQ